MKNIFNSTRDIIIRTNEWDKALQFYGSVMGFPADHHSETLIGFETGAFYIYIEKGEPHGPVGEFLTSDIEAARQKLLSADCSIFEEDELVPRCYIKDPFGLMFNVGKSQD